jgi:hypothetical protein
VKNDELWKAGGCLHGRGKRKNKQGGPRIDGLHFFIFVNTRVDRTQVVFARDIHTETGYYQDMLCASVLSAHAQIVQTFWLPCRLP